MVTNSGEMQNASTPKTKKIISLKLNKEFKRVYHRGKTFVTPSVVLYYAKSRRPFCRLGITAGKKIGGAVERNRAKRIIRAAYSAVISQLDLSETRYDFVIVARPRCLTQKSTEIERQFYFALSESGLIKK